MSRKHTSTNQKNKLDVVIATAGRYDMLEKCIESLHNQTTDKFNIYIVDGNDDIQQRNANREILDKYDAKMLGMSVGFPRLANTGARMGKAPLILFLGDDVTLKPNAIELMLETMEKMQDVGVLGIKLLFPENSSDNIRPAGKVQHIGLAMDVNANVIHPLSGWSADNPKCCVSRECFAVTGAAFLIRRNLFDKVGGFDEDYGIGTYEDVSACLSVRSLGKKVYINTDIVGYHYVGATAQAKNTPFPLKRNQQIFQAKWSQSGFFTYDSWTYL